MLLGGAALVFGWRVFWFLTDDAYIAFRYVSNAHLGYGYVWNAPPFLPVEGYTSFLWVLLLDIVWRILGVEPPASANWISLVFSCSTLVLAAERLAAPVLLEAPGTPWEGGMVHAIAQYSGKHWGPDLGGQVDSGMATGNSLAAIECWLAHAGLRNARGPSCPAEKP